MAWTKPSIIVPGAADGDTSQVCTDSQHDQPLRLKGAFLVRLLITEVIERHACLGGNFLGRSMTDKDGLSAPLNSDGLANTHAADVEFSRRQREDVGGRAHGRDEFDHEDAGRGGIRESDSGEEEVGEGTAFGFGDSVDAIVGEAVVDGAEFVESGGLGSGEGGGDVGGGGLLEGGVGGAEARGVDGRGSSAGEKLGGGPRG
mmetsp:Transcript_19454/g.31490  ORF Transcript_19454/g.31490 Transcript_19454/m.31490 type:complete len:202 (+) Transcript_19454:445-1050(+)